MLDEDNSPRANRAPSPANASGRSESQAQVPNFPTRVSIVWILGIHIRGYTLNFLRGLGSSRIRHAMSNDRHPQL